MNSKHSVIPAPPLVRVYDWHAKMGRKRGGSSGRAGPFCYDERVWKPHGSMSVVGLLKIGEGVMSVGKNGWQRWGDFSIIYD